MISFEAGAAEECIKRSEDKLNFDTMGALARASATGGTM
jgi:hypothetical protein